MTNLTHLFKVGQPIRYLDEDMNKSFKGTVTKIESDYILCNVVGISDHMRFEEDFNLEQLYPVYNF